MLQKNSTPIKKTTYFSHIHRLWLFKFNFIKSQNHHEKIHHYSVLFVFDFYFKLHFFKSSWSTFFLYLYRFSSNIKIQFDPCNTVVKPACTNQGYNLLQRPWFKKLAHKKINLMGMINVLLKFNCRKFRNLINTKKNLSLS